MDEQADNWLDYDRFAVFGLGRSGRAASRLLSELGKTVVASDTGSRADLEGAIEDLPDDVEFVFGRNAIADAEVAVVSPGLKPRFEIFDALRSRGVPAVSEIEIAFDAAEAPVLALTGTDGKTTTTSILGEIAAASDRPSAVGGNIGTPLSAVVGDVPAAGIIVAEVSAFQLWSTFHFRPDVAGFTNIAGDHLDYFDSRAAYREAKRRLEENVVASDWVVYNGDDPTVDAWYRDRTGRRALYSLDRRPDAGADLALWRQGTRVVAERSGETVEIVDESEISLRGDHNVSNVMCAAGMALAHGLGPEAIRKGIRAFEPLPHRVEPCGTAEGVSFVNDSKATNVNAALAGLESLEDGFVAIVGGVDKGLDLEPLCRHLGRHAGGVVVIGDISERLVEELRDVVDRDFRLDVVGSLEEATRRAFEWARPGQGTVVLSPACSSFDMFDSYEHRGRVFREAVDALR
mgnify:CR=1 FL=1